MKLKAIQYMRYNRKPVKVGEVFEVASQDARILIAIGRAEVYVEPPKRQVPAVFKPIDAPVEDEKVEVDEPKKRAYKRRDMVAE